MKTAKTPKATTRLPSTTTLGEWLTTHSNRASSQADGYDLQQIACQVLDISRAQLVTHPEQILSQTSLSELEPLADRLHAGEPLAYLMQQKEFWSLALKVTPAVLIPRPETELLVEVGLAKAQLLMEQGRAPRILELGTGSGAVSLAIASELQFADLANRAKPSLIATDFSAAALQVAAANAAQLALPITFVQADWLDPLAAGIDLLLSNPPYIAEQDAHLPALKYEPTSALVSGPEGLDALRRIIEQASVRLSSGGWLALEHGFDQAPAVQQLMQDNGLVTVSTEADLAGLDRVTLGQQPTQPSPANR